MSSTAPRVLSTYRLQLREEFNFAAATQAIPYLASLGVSHLYLSPILQATPGSDHGYDVTDHRYISESLGGLTEFKKLAAAAQDADMGIIVDVVPNHMAVPTPAWLNPALWSVLKHGPQSDYASWVDVDWTMNNTLLMPVLGDRIGAVLDRGELEVADFDGEPVLQYFDHQFPIRQGTEHLDLDEMLERQWYRLAYWKIADEELNYRRFFDIDTLAAVCVEHETVFKQTHDTLLQLVDSGHISGLRIDHPDGLSDPAKYLDMLAKETNHSYVVVEKILSGDEELPEAWQCHGTTGYDALDRVSGLFEPAESAAETLSFWRRFTGIDTEYSEVVSHAKRTVAKSILHAEVERLIEQLVTICKADVRLRDHSRRGLGICIRELLIHMDRYRAYISAGEKPSDEARSVIEAATDHAKQHIDDEHHDTLQVVQSLILGEPVGNAELQHHQDRLEFITRFGQTCSPVMAKGVEDTAAYRWFPFPGRCEVGRDAADLGTSIDGFHAFATRLAEKTPGSMTTLSTHDTKRSEDTRAVLSTILENPVEWASHVTTWSERARAESGVAVDPAIEYLLWHTVIALASPTDLPETDRIVKYLTKAVREAKLQTSWVDQDPTYEAELTEYVTAALACDDLREAALTYRAELQPAVRANVLGQKLVQLVMPGVPDVYQGSEVMYQSVVDPDNRGLVDYAVMQHVLSDVQQESVLPGSVSSEKMQVTHQALRARQDYSSAFVGPNAGYMPVAASTTHVVGFARLADGNPQCVALATRLPRTLARLGGWADHHVTLPSGTWLDVLSGAEYRGGSTPAAQLFATRPVALLIAGD